MSACRSVLRAVGGLVVNSYQPVTVSAVIVSHNKVNIHHKSQVGPCSVAEMESDITRYINSVVFS